MYLKKALFTLAFSASTLSLLAQSSSAISSDNHGGGLGGGGTLTVQESIAYALQNNVQLKQSELSLQNSINTLEQSRWLKYPTVNGFSGLNSNFGRNVDPFSNTIVTNAIATNNLGVGSNVTLFNGHRIKNTVALNELSAEASKLDVETLRNNITLNVVTAYLNVLSTEDLIEVAQKQLEVTTAQLDRMRILVDGGVLPEINLADLEAQLANDELQLVNAQNNHQSAILTLKQVMNMPANRAVSVARVTMPDPTMQLYPESAFQIYEAAVAYLPEVKAASTRIAVAEKNIALATAIGKPNVTASGSWGTTYSTAAKDLIPGESTNQEIPVTATFQGQTVPFVLNFPQTNYLREGIPYFRQLNNNQNLNLGVSLNVPIFNAYQAKYRVAGAKIQKLQSELELDNTRLQIRQNIDQAYISMLNASKSYSATLAQVNALGRTFGAAEARYNAGAANFTDYILARTRLDQAKTNLVQTKYNLIFRIKILDFYQNKPLDF